MEKLNYKIKTDDNGLVTELEIEGPLVLDNALDLKNEFVGVVGRLAKSVKISIKNITDIDVSCVQLFLALIRYLDENHVVYQLDWNLEGDQKALLESVGLGNELFLN